MGGDTPQSVVQVGDLRIDRVRMQVTVHGREIRLTRQEFELLWAFASEVGRAFTRQELVERAWGPRLFVDPRTVDVHIARLRRKLKADSANLRFIETVWGIGYRFRYP